MDNFKFVSFLIAELPTDCFILQDLTGYLSTMDISLHTTSKQKIHPVLYSLNININLYVVLEVLNDFCNTVGEN